MCSINTHKALEKARKEVDKATEEEKAKLNEQILQREAQLAEAHSKGERALSFPGSPERFGKSHRKTGVESNLISI